MLVIEHHLDVIKNADHVIDLGPFGGDRGGTIVATGTPEEIAANPASHTGRFLRETLGRHGRVVAPPSDDDGGASRNGNGRGRGAAGRRGRPKAAPAAG